MPASRVAACKPITTKCNHFWREDDTLPFLVKGVYYVVRHSAGESRPSPSDPHSDPLADDRLSEIRRDLDIIRELGLNTIFVSHLDYTKSHHEALQLLADAGIYVVVAVGEHISSPNGHPESDPNFDTQQRYSENNMMEILQLVEQIADYPNILGISVSGGILRGASTTKMAEVIRAYVRDIKTYIRMRGGRIIPVGVSNPQTRLIEAQLLQYFTAGVPSDLGRVDFFAPSCYSWAHKSSFQTSGWKDMVKLHQQTPVPRFLAQFGTYIGQERIWHEIECLYSPNMTQVFSGGCFYTFAEYGNGYGIVDIDDDGTLRKKPEFDTLKRKFDIIDSRTPKEIFGDEKIEKSAKPYETWEGKFPEQKNGRWYATQDIPSFPGDWSKVVRDLSNDSDWVIVHRHERDLGVEDASGLAIATQRLSLRG